MLVPCAGCSVINFSELIKKLTDEDIVVSLIKLSVDYAEAIQLDEIIAEMVDIIRHSSEKIVLFGHSMGGILILKLLECLSPNELNQISGIVFSSSVPPHTVETLQRKIPNVNSDSFQEYLIELGNLNKAHFEDEFFKEYLFERIKRDFSILKELELQADIDYNEIFKKIPTLVIKGEEEPMHEEFLLQWLDYENIDMKTLSGDHFHYKQNTEKIALEIKKRGVLID